MQKQYEANGWIKTIEEDIYANGCIPESCKVITGDDIFKSTSLLDVINQCQCYAGTQEKEASVFDSCDEKGRLDVSIMENADGFPASTREIASWKEGKIELYSCTYSFNINLVTRKPVALTN